MHKYIKVMFEATLIYYTLYEKYKNKLYTHIHNTLYIHICTSIYIYIYVLLHVNY